MKKLTYILLSLISIFVISCCTNDENNWLQFRGPNALGVASENAKPPIDFGIDKNVHWKIETPKGFSSPCIINNNLIITGVNNEEKK